MATKEKQSTRAAARAGKVNRGIKPRKRDDYTNEQFGRGDSSLPPDDKTINDRLCRVNLVRPRYNEGPLVFRPWPALLPEDPTKRLEPGRITPNERGQGMWIRRMPTANYVGLPDQDCEKSTFILYDPSDKHAKATNPFRIFYFACKQAEAAGEFGNGKAWDSKWNKLMKGSKKGGAAISRPAARWFVQGEVYVNGDRDYLDGDRTLPLGAAPEDDLCIIQLPSSAGDGLMGLLDVRKSDWDGDEKEDPSGPYKYGDPCGILQSDGSLKGGIFVTVFNPKKNKEITKHTSWDGKISDVQGYEAAISRVYRNGKEKITPDLDAERVQQIFEKWQFWTPDPEEPDARDGLLYIPPVEQQCLWIAQGYKKEPRLLKFAWADNPEFFTEEVKAVLKDRAQASVPSDVEDDEDDEFDESKKGGGKKKNVKKDPTQGSAKSGKKKGGKQDDDDFDDDDDDVEEDDEDDEFDESDEDDSDDDDDSDDSDSDDDDSDDDDSDDEDSDDDSDDEDSDDADDADDDSDDEDSDDEDSDDEDSDDDDSDEESDDDSDDEESDDEDSDDEDSDDDSDDEDSDDEDSDDEDSDDDSDDEDADDEDDDDVDDDDYFGGAADGKADKKGGKADTKKPDTKKSDTKKPVESKKPDAKKPDAKKPDAKKPDAKKSDKSGKDKKSDKSGKDKKADADEFEEDDSVSPEFDPEDKVKTEEAKLAKAMKAAQGRSGKRSSGKSEAPAAPKNEKKGDKKPEGTKKPDASKKPEGKSDKKPEGTKKPEGKPTSKPTDAKSADKKGSVKPTDKKVTNKKK